MSVPASICPLTASMFPDATASIIGMSGGVGRASGVDVGGASVAVKVGGAAVVGVGVSLAAVGVGCGVAVGSAGASPPQAAVATSRAADSARIQATADLGLTCFIVGPFRQGFRLRNDAEVKAGDYIITL